MIFLKATTDAVKIRVKWYRKRLSQHECVRTTTKPQKSTWITVRPSYTKNIVVRETNSATYKTASYRRALRRFSDTLSWWLNVASVIKTNCSIRLIER